MISVLPRLHRRCFVTKPAQRILLALERGSAARRCHRGRSRLGKEWAEVGLEDDLYEEVLVVGCRRKLAVQDGGGEVAGLGCGPGF